ncbi:MAG: hypothetical protein VR65_19155 [Desulfobulbaceae bacterium BRH_c16a]|nr:MAG: hypothetical protein VR65_19155 [Desulfobulbaceae bacterium BRH_c16a]
MPTARTLTFTSAHRVVDRVHCHASNMRTIAFPSVSSGFAEFLALVLAVPYLTDTGAAIAVEFPHLTGWQTNKDVSPFFCHKLGTDTGTAHKLSTFADFHLDVMDNCTKRNIYQWKTVARLNVNIVTCNNSIAYRYSIRRKDISLFTIHIAQQGNIRRAIRIVLD